MIRSKLVALVYDISLLNECAEDGLTHHLQETALLHGHFALDVELLTDRRTFLGHLGKVSTFRTDHERRRCAHRRRSRC